MDLGMSVFSVRNLPWKGPSSGCLAVIPYDISARSQRPYGADRLPRAARRTDARPGWHPASRPARARDVRLLAVGTGGAWMRREVTLSDGVGRRLFEFGDHLLSQ